MNDDKNTKFEFHRHADEKGGRLFLQGWEVENTYKIRIK